MIDKAAPHAREHEAQPPAPHAPAAGSAEHLPRDSSVGLLLRMAHRGLVRHLQERLEPHGLSIGHWFILRVLWENDGINQTELSQRAGTMAPATVAVVNALEAKQIVTRRPDLKDKRKQLVALTPEGRRLKHVLLPIAAEVNDIAVSDLSPDEEQEFLQLLHRVQAKLSGGHTQF